MVLRIPPALNLPTKQDRSRSHSAMPLFASPRVIRQKVLHVPSANLGIRQGNYSVHCLRSTILRALFVLGYYLAGGHSQHGAISHQRDISSCRKTAPETASMHICCWEVVRLGAGPQPPVCLQVIL
jgi:hypothetical protein